jgi:hypothetical protein
MLLLFVDGGGFGHGWGDRFGGPRLVVVGPGLGGRPIHQACRQFFPLAALGTEIPYPVAYLLVLGNDLVRPILQYEALVGGLRQPSGADDRQEQRENEQEAKRQHGRVITLDETAKTMFTPSFTSNFHSFSVPAILVRAHPVRPSHPQ